MGLDSPVMSDTRGDPLLSQPPDDRGEPTPRRTRDRAPNYAARRLLVSAAGVVAVTLVALVVWRFAGGDDGNGVVAVDWDEFVIVDRGGGSIETFDNSGEPGIELDVGEPIQRVEAGGDRLALITDDAIILTDARDGGTATFGVIDTDVPTIGTASNEGAGSSSGSPTAPTTALPTAPTTSATTTTSMAPGSTVTDPTGAIKVAIPPGAEVRRLPVDDELVLAVGTGAGGNALVVRGDGEVVDIGELAGQTDPFLFLDSITTNATGTHVAVADARNFQTIVVTDAATEPTFFPDQPMAVGESLIATSQVVGGRAEISLYDLDGERRTSVSSDLAVGGVITDDRLTYVTAGGLVVRLEPDDDEPSELAELAVPGGASVTSVAPTWDGDRLVASGSTFETIVDLEGESLFTTTFASATDVAVPSYAAVCLVVGDEADAHSLVRLEDGTTVADLDGDVVVSTAERACTTLVERTRGADEQYVLVTEDGAVELGRLRSADLAPDGRSAVVVTTTGLVQLLPFEDDGTVGEPIDVGGPTLTIVDVAFLDR